MRSANLPASVSNPLPRAATVATHKNGVGAPCVGPGVTGLTPAHAGPSLFAGEGLRPG
jgi:hypothetical protein